LVVKKRAPSRDVHVPRSRRGLEVEAVAADPQIVVQADVEDEVVGEAVAVGGRQLALVRAVVVGQRRDLAA
jgi:hypothetical protein